MDSFFLPLTDWNVWTCLEMTIMATAASQRSMTKHFRRPGHHFRRSRFCFRWCEIFGVPDVDVFNEPCEPLLHRRVRLRLNKRKSFRAAAETVRRRSATAVLGSSPTVAVIIEAGRAGKGWLPAPDGKLLRLWKFFNFSGKKHFSFREREKTIYSERQVSRCGKLPEMVFALYILWNNKLGRFAAETNKIYLCLEIVNFSVKILGPFLVVWPDLAKFHHFGNILWIFVKWLRVYSEFGKFLNLLWQNSFVLGSLLMLYMTKYRKII